MNEFIFSFCSNIIILEGNWNFHSRQDAPKKYAKNDLNLPGH